MMNGDKSSRPMLSSGGEREMHAVEERIGTEVTNHEGFNKRRKKEDIIALTDGECVKINGKLGVVEGSEEMNGSYLIRCGCLSGDVVISVNEMGGLRIGVGSEYFRGPEKISALCGEVEKFCVGGSEGGSCYCWELWGTGRLIRKWEAHYKKITCIRAIARRRQLVTASEDALIRLWLFSLILDDTAALTPYRTLDGHTLPTRSIISLDPYSPYGRLASVGLDHTLRFWEHTGKLIVSKHFPNGLTALAANLSETTLILGSVLGSMYLVDILDSSESTNTFTTLPSPHRAAIVSLLFTATNDHFFSASTDGIVCLWKDGTPILVPALSGKPVRALIFSSFTDTNRCILPTFFQRQPRPSTEPLFQHHASTTLASFCLPIVKEKENTGPNHNREDIKVISTLLADLEALKHESSRWRAVCDTLWKKRKIQEQRTQQDEEAVAASATTAGIIALGEE